MHKAFPLPGKFEQWQFRIQQYLQHEHYALWEVIEFGDSYKVPTNTDPNDTTRRRDDEQSRRTVTITTEDIQRKKNDVKARTTLLLSLPDEHQLRFSKYKTAKELWDAILKTFGGNKTTKKRKKNLLKQQYGNFKAEGSETLEQTFNRLQVIMMHTIVWRNRNDLDTMSLDDLYNHLKVYEAEVQTKSNSNSQNMVFISSSKNSSGNEDGNIACVSTASTTFPTDSVNVATISQDIASAYIASQSNGSQIKFEDINQIDEDDMEEIDIKWSMALLSMRSTQKSGKKAMDKGWDWSYMENEREDHALVADEETPTEFALMANTENKEVKLEKDGLDGKLAGLLKASKNLDQVKEGVGYNAVPPPATDLYLSPKKDISWTGLPEFVDDTVTDYSRPSTTIPSSEFVLHNKPCFNCGDFSHLGNDCRGRVQREKTMSQKYAYESPSHKSIGHRSHRSSMRPSYRPAGHRPHGPTMNPRRPTMNGARPYKSFFN
nr:ribonuclease H-like domain-containing protein [Tanacetum cinerariifolium]